MPTIACERRSCSCGCGQEAGRERDVKSPHPIQRRSERPPSTKGVKRQQRKVLIEIREEESLII